MAIYISKEKTMKNNFLEWINAWIFNIYNDVSSYQYYYISPNGNNTDGLTEATAFNNISSLSGITLTDTTIVMIERGYTYYGSATLLGGGSVSNNAIIRSYGSGDYPIISGINTIAAWTNLGGNLWESTSAVSTLSSLRVVMVDDVIVAMGRTPSAGDWYDVQSATASSITSTDVDSAVVDWTGADVVIRKRHWILDSDTITLHSGNTINHDGSATYTPSPLNGFYIQNDVRCCTEQNDWYFNPSTKKITIYSSSEPTNVKVSSVDTLLTVNGNDYVTIENISFDGADTYGVYLQSCDKIKLRGCNITNIGCDAIMGVNTTGISDNLIVENCKIENVLNNGIRLYSQFENAEVSRNKINNIGIISGAGGNGDGNYSAILSQAAGLYAHNNWITNIGYIPITSTGNDVLIYRNYIDSYNLTIDDGAGIYFGFNYSNRVANENVIINGIGNYDMIYPVSYGAAPVYAHGIYLDDDSVGVTVTNNGISDVGGSGIYVHNNSGSHYIHNNNVYNAKSFLGAVYFRPNSGGVQMTNNDFQYNVIVVIDPTRPVLNMYSYFDDLADYGTFNNNVYSRPFKEDTVVRYDDLSSPETDVTISDWYLYSGHDQNTTSSPSVPTGTGDLMFLYNPSDYNKVVTLASQMLDFVGGSYSGSITLSAWETIILIADN